MPSKLDLRKAWLIALSAVGILVILKKCLRNEGTLPLTTKSEPLKESAEAKLKFLRSIATDIDKKYFDNLPPLPPGETCSALKFKGLIPLANAGGQYRMGMLVRNSHIYRGKDRCPMEKNQAIQIIASFHSCFLVELNHPCGKSKQIYSGYVPIVDVLIGSMQAY